MFQSPIHRGTSINVGVTMSTLPGTAKFQSPIHRGTSINLNNWNYSRFNVILVSIPYSSGHFDQRG